MSFKTLRNDELADIAEFFVKDVVTADAEKPTKKELLAALASGEEGTEDEPVTWEQYNEIYLPALERPAPVRATDDAVITSETVQSQGVAVTEALPTEVIDGKLVSPSKDKNILVKMERQNPRFEIRGAVFTKAHPFALMNEEDAVYVVQHEPGFRIALPSEAESYYQ